MSQSIVPTHGPMPRDAAITAALLGSALALADVLALLVVLPIPVVLMFAPLLVGGDQIDLGVWLIDTRPEAWLASIPGTILVAVIVLVTLHVARRQRSWGNHQVARPAASSQPTPSPTDAGLQELTERETQVLELMSQGLTNGTIAQQLVISEATVRKHVGRIFAKLNVDAASNDRRVTAVLAFVRHSK